MPNGQVMVPGSHQDLWVLFTFWAHACACTIIHCTCNNIQCTAISGSQQNDKSGGDQCGDTIDLGNLVGDGTGPASSTASPYPTECYDPR